ncbi:exported protein of unknown function [Cardinium endosymbiont cEper1 of Encarsia pergandiella]|nr:exported protein of unknown function [Cardinium endosymbiont cEper1 of Encarsia pergandiella]
MKKITIFVLLIGFLAQLVRASVLHTEGRRFESYRAHASYQFFLYYRF